MADAENDAYWQKKRYNPDLIISTSTIEPSLQCSIIITGLTANVTYYFRVWYIDAEGNCLQISSGATNYPQIVVVGHTDGSRDDYVELASGGGCDSGTNIVYAKTSACGRVFVMRGGEYTDFYEYDIPANLWRSKSPTPYPQTTGACMVWTGPGIYERYIYALVGNSNKFLRYDIETNTWDDVNVADLPPPRWAGAGSAMVWDGSDYIYFLSTGTGGPFLRYSLSNNTWDETPTDFGTAVEAGGALTWDGTYIYGTNGTTVFKRYDPTSNIWVTLGNIPAEIGAGGSLLYTGENCGSKAIYCIRGGGYTDIWHYDVETDSWVPRKPLPAVIGTNTGNRLAFHSDKPSLEHMYIWRGVTSTTLWCYRRDISSPSVVTDFTAVLPSGECQIKLTFSCPGDNNGEDDLPEISQFWIQYSTYDGGWDRKLAQIKITTGPVTKGELQTVWFTPPQWGETYYFKLWICDTVKNWSAASNTAGPVSFTPTRTISGQLKDGETNQPLEGITVIAAGIKPAYAITDINGNYTLEVAACQQYVVIASSSSMYFSTVTVTGVSSTYSDRYNFSSVPQNYTGVDFIGYKCYGNIYYSDLSENYVELDSSIKKISIRFTAKETQTYTRFHYYRPILTGGRTDVITVQLWSDNGKGIPGSLISQTTDYINSGGATGWQSIIGGISWSLTKGTTYHIVIFSTATFDSTWRVRIRYSEPIQCRNPVDGTPNVTENLLYFNGTVWQCLNYQPIFALTTAGSPPAEGNPYAKVSYGTGYQIFGSTWIGQQFWVETDTFSAKYIHFYLRRSVTLPEDSCYWELRGPNSFTNIISSGILATADTVGTSFSWFAAAQDILCPAELTTNSTYWLILKSPGSSLGYYELATMFVDSTGSGLLSISYGGTGNLLVKTVDAGSTLTTDNQRDTIFKIRISTVVTGGPKTITALIATPAETEGAIKLTWTYPGICGKLTLSEGSHYKIEYSTYDAGKYQFNINNAQVTITTGPVDVGEQQTYILQGLQENVTYYMVVWYWHSILNVTSLQSNVATAYASIIKPAAITDLSVQPSQWGRCIDLTWTAPGDDGWENNIVGGKYKIRYATYPVSDWTSDWNNETDEWKDFVNKFEIVWSTDVVPLEKHFRRLTGLDPGVTYYIRIWTRDENANGWSLISNGATSWAQIVIIGVEVKGYEELLWSTTYNFGWLQTNISSITAYGLVIENTGNVYEDYGVRINTDAMKNVYGTIWTIDNSSSVYYDRFVLEGLFYNLRPYATYYGTAYSNTDDVITDTLIWSADGTKYHPPANVNQQENTKGVCVVPFVDQIDDRRTFWFHLWTPLATSTTDQQTIPVEFWAKENVSVGPPP